MPVEDHTPFEYLKDNDVSTINQCTMSRTQAQDGASLTRNRVGCRLLPSDAFHGTNRTEYRR